MTKEKLLSKQFASGNMIQGTKVVSVDNLIEFFEQNVCIPKGDNRHKYADVWHEWLEDTKLKLGCDCHYEDETISTDYISPIPPYEIFIKKSEPVYEYQWLIICTIDCVPNKLSEFMTQEEWDNRGQGDHCFTFTRLEETKRIRNVL